VRVRHSIVSAIPDPAGSSTTSLSRTCGSHGTVVLPMRLMTVSKVRRGRPRQLIEMNENRRCSTLFHLLVPDGKWLTWDRNVELVSDALQLDDFPQLAHPRGSINGLDFMFR